MFRSLIFLYLCTLSYAYQNITSSFDSWVYDKINSSTVYSVYTFTNYDRLKDVRIEFAGGTLSFQITMLLKFKSLSNITTTYTFSSGSNEVSIKYVCPMTNSSMYNFVTVEVFNTQSTTVVNDVSIRLHQEYVNLTRGVLHRLRDCQYSIQTRYYLQRSFYTGLFSSGPIRLFARYISKTTNDPTFFGFLVKYNPQCLPNQISGEVLNYNSQKTYDIVIQSNQLFENDTYWFVPKAENVYAGFRPNCSNQNEWYTYDFGWCQGINCTIIDNYSATTTTDTISTTVSSQSSTSTSSSIKLSSFTQIITNNGEPMINDHYLPIVVLIVMLLQLLLNFS